MFDSLAQSSRAVYVNSIPFRFIVPNVGSGHVSDHMSQITCQRFISRRVSVEFVFLLGSPSDPTQRLVLGPGHRVWDSGFRISISFLHWGRFDSVQRLIRQRMFARAYACIHKKTWQKPDFALGSARLVSGHALRVTQWCDVLVATVKRQETTIADSSRWPIGRVTAL